MHIIFDWAGIPLHADITFDDDDIEFDTLTCNGFEAGFLLDTIHSQSIYDAAYTAATASYRKAIEDLRYEHAAEHMENAYA